MKKLWNFLSDLRLTFWLLVAITAILVIGGLYSAFDYSFVDSINGARVQDWFFTTGITALHKSWWLPALFLAFTLFAVNTTACSIDRIITLVKKRKNMPFKTFSVLLSPSLIHCVFLIILAGHFITFVAVKQERLPMVPGNEITLPDGSVFTVGDIRTQYYGDETLLRNRISQMKVSLAPKLQGTAVREIEFAEPHRVGTSHLHLDVDKKAAKMFMQKRKIVIDESCNKERVFNPAEYRNRSMGPRIYLLVTTDPGLPLIVAGFIFLILIMVWYYYQVLFSRTKTITTEE